MAEQALKKLEEQLNCPICLSTYINPKQLQCHHVCCQACLVHLAVQDQQGQLTLTCPSCRHITPVPASGIAGLQSAFHINHLLEIHGTMKQVCDPLDVQEKAVGGSPGASTVEKISYCSVHSKKELELYCETCGELACLKCVITGGQHHNHVCKELAEAFDKCKEEIASSLEPVEKQLVSIRKALARLDACCGEISNQQVAIESDIHSTVSRLHEILDVRQTELITQLHGITQAKLNNLAVQKNQLELIQAQLSSCVDFARENLTNGGHREVLGMKATMAKQIKELAFQPAMLEPNIDASLRFSISADVTTACQSYGVLSAPNLPDPSKCFATGRALETATVDEKCAIEFHAIDFEGQPCSISVQSLKCELVSEITATAVQGVAERKKNMLYRINYQPTVKGRHSLHIKLSDQHIKGSPFTVAVKSPVEKLGTPIASAHGLKDPWGVTSNWRGEFFITDKSDSCISMFSPGGQKLRSFGSRGEGREDFSSARGLVADKEGNLLVVDGKNHRILKLTAQGQFIAAVGTKGNGHLQFDNPYGITVSASNKNKVYVTDANHRVQVLNSDLTFSSIFGKRGTEKGQFQYPYGIACDSTGKVYVVDSSNHRIQIFSAKEKFLGMFGRYGKGRGELCRPFGIAIDSSDNLYIGDWENFRICVFTSKGQFVTSFGQEGVELGMFKAPWGIAVDENGVVCVCDFCTCLVQMF